LIVENELLEAIGILLNVAVAVVPNVKAPIKVLFFAPPAKNAPLSPIVTVPAKLLFPAAVPKFNVLLFPAVTFPVMSYPPLKLVVAPVPSVIFPFIVFPKLVATPVIVPPTLFPVVIF